MNSPAQCSRRFCGARGRLPVYDGYSVGAPRVDVLDPARLSVLRRSFEHLTAPQDIEEPVGASEVEIARASSATLA